MGSMVLCVLTLIQPGRNRTAAGDRTAAQSFVNWVERIIVSIYTPAILKSFNLCLRESVADCVYPEQKLEEFLQRTIDVGIEAHGDDGVA